MKYGHLYNFIYNEHSLGIQTLDNIVTICRINKEWQPTLNTVVMPFKTKITEAYDLSKYCQRISMVPGIKEKEN